MELVHEPFTCTLGGTVVHFLTLEEKHTLNPPTNHRMRDETIVLRLGFKLGMYECNASL